MTDSESLQPEPANDSDKPTDPSASNPLGKVKGFVEEHPVAMVAGGIVLGALVAGALARGSGALGDKATRKGTLARMSLPRRAVDLATIGIELAAAYVAGAAGEKAAAAADDAESDTKPAKPGLPAIATKALSTIGPLIARRLPGNRSE
ncbi:hypothetical protein [Novosphingobium sp. PASSN1]|uniref:hypothetical protein n=1 Tax=Novosphingobium sp. PASSN1 TaxID=2015561 RepID=UPI000BC6D608|nr:hypothetical protein [Novosphingobium sp. PASSN1]OYU33344.1 MAG: hypothetical protein CFE35_20575 [Novosphingobium sp. PASSN1]